MGKNAFTFVLHAHLPYVLAHGSWPHGMDWLWEATCETYIPLVRELETLIADGISPQITLGVTPVLCEQLADERFRAGLEPYLALKIKAARDDADQFARTGEPHLADLARDWERFYTGLRHTFEAWNGDLLGRLRRMQEQGHLEIITCAATHGYLPLLGLDANVSAQIKGGVETYRRHFGCDPRGIWLPECAYRPGYEWTPPVAEAPIPKAVRPGIEVFLAQQGLDYFIVDSALLRGGRAMGVYIDRFEALAQLWQQFEQHYQPRPEERDRSPYEPYLVGSASSAEQALRVETAKPVWVFARDPRTGLQVWSGEHGYPGDGWYLDFHKKHWPGGHRYWRVTHSQADLGGKEVYQPERVADRLAAHAAHFVQLVADTLAQFQAERGEPGILVAPYDAELFGHWWFEGVRWLGQVCRRLHHHPTVVARSCGRFLQTREGPQRLISLPEGSWGEGGFHYIWLNQATEWTWKRIYECEQKMKEIVERWRNGDQADQRQVLQQLGRELLLLESSDWQFLISTWHARDYAEHRFATHYERFTRLAEMVERAARGEMTASDRAFLAEVGDVDRLFPNLQPTWWAPGLGD